MKFFSLICIITLFPFANLHAQEGNNWYTDFNHGINFKCAPPSVSWPQVKNLPFEEGSCTTSMSDTNGNLLFFSDSRSIYNSLGQVMPNGENILANIDSDVGLIRHVIAVPDPGSINRYYIFYTTIGDTIVNGTHFSTLPYLSYVVVDMRANGGYGDVTGAYHHIENNLEAAITASRHRNKRDFWLLGYTMGDGFSVSDTFITYLVSPKGITRNLQAVIDSTHNFYNPVFSNDGRRIAVYEFESTVLNAVKVYDFNDSSGLISNPIEIRNVTNGIYGLTFSPDNSKLYIVAERNSSPYYNYLYQYDVSVGNSAQAVNVSKTIIYKNPPNSGFDLQAAPDGKIYGVNTRPNSRPLWSIDNPNEKGAACHFNPLAVPNAVASYLPNFITRHPYIMPYAVSGFCNNFPTVFNPFQNLYSPTYHWDFGEPSSDTANTSSKRIGVHLYKNPGTYKVHFASWNYDSIMDTFTRFVCISNGLNPVKMDTSLCSGETVTLDAGNAGAKYLWNTGDTTETKKVSSGIFWVVVSNGSCMITDTFHIAGLSAYTLNLGHDTALAAGSKLTLKTGYPQTIWSNGTVADSIQVSQPGTYWAMLKGDKCQQTDTIHLLTLVNIDTNLCAGENITLDPGNPGAKYTWNDGSSSRTKTVSAGTYWVKVSFGSLSFSDSFHVVSLSTAKINLGKNTTIKNGETITLYSGYRHTVWSTGAIGDSIKVTKAGTFWAALKGDKCEVSDTIHITQNTGIEMNQTDGVSGLYLFPNPAHGMLSVGFTTDYATQFSISIYDQNGKLILVQKYNSTKGPNKTNIDISLLSTGDYILKMVSDNSSATRKFEVGE